MRFFYDAEEDMFITERQDDDGDLRYDTYFRERHVTLDADEIGDLSGLTELTP